MTPIKLYKYKAINKFFIDSLVNGTIYFARPDELNDPFDCKVDIKNSISNAAKSLDGTDKQKLIELLKDEEVFDNLKNDINNLGVCSFSGVFKCDQQEVLMWTHYANNHRGVCIKYEFPWNFVDKDDEIVSCSNVSYDPEALTTWFKSSEILSLDFNSEEFIMELAKKMLTIKSPSWCYESEIRIIRRKRGSFKIPKLYIRGICFGLETPVSDIELIRKIVNNFYSNVDFYKNNRGNSDFGLDIGEYNIALPSDS